LKDPATAERCTVCRRYGILWAYDFEGERIKVLGNTHIYVRGEAIEFHLKICHAMDAVLEIVGSKG
jgi:hypothetical protein